MKNVQVMFNHFVKYIKCKNPAYFGTYLEAFTFFFKRTKVKLYSTANNMEDLFDPPKHLNGMKKLDRSAFKKTVIVSSLIVPQNLLNDVLTLVKKYLLKIKALKPVQEVEDKKEKILIDPRIIDEWNSFDESLKEKLESLNISESNFFKIPIQMEYENWGHEALIKAVLPKDEQVLTSFSVIGHIIHLNIKNNLLEYKNVIGEILLDKVSFAKTVVYKKHFIDNVYRNFEMEVICGEPNFIVSIKANNCVFEFDFSKVYWNPRLNTEHGRITKSLNKDDVLFDVFCGVGPFAILAAKKKCLVFANDLNPESVKWLEHNIKLNKKSVNYITTYNKDGKDFILEDVKKQYLNILQDNLFCGKIHVVMNLPGAAPTFMKYFKNLLDINDLNKVDLEKLKKCLPIIHCYFFANIENCKKASFEQSSEMSLDNIEYLLHFVRNVSSLSSMYKMEFTLPFDYLVANNENDEPLPKRICAE